MEEKLNHLKELTAEIADLAHVAALVEWDQQVCMPRGGAEDRSHHLATLHTLIHHKMTSDEVGKLLDELGPYAQQIDPDSDEARILDLTRYQYDQYTKVPAKWVSEFARVTTIGQTTWEKAKAASDFELFRPHLERIVELRREYAEFFKPYDHVYDPLLDSFERGMKTADVKAIFDGLRPQQVELIRAISERPQVDNSFLKQAYDEKQQWDFGVDVITRLGYDWNRGRQDKAVHPFSINFGLGDARITTRFDPDYPMASLFGTMHEAGHAMYEQGGSPAYSRTILEGGASMAVHESQSRMMENLIGRSKAFWKFFYAPLQERFPAQLSGVSLETFYKGINIVQPSFIRVEADEATYNLHIMLRLELEIAMMEGSLVVKDLPEVWNNRMQEYLGVTPPNDAKGVLQDVHWSGGMIGYFPTYALGNLVSAQLWECMQKDMPDMDSQIEHGEFGAIVSWLRQNIHSHASKFKPQELIQKVTGSKIDPQPYVRYLKQKYGEIYGL